MMVGNLVFMNARKVLRTFTKTRDLSWSIASDSKAANPKLTVWIVTPAPDTPVC